MSNLTNGWQLVLGIILVTWSLMEWYSRKIIKIIEEKFALNTDQETTQ